MIQKRLHLSLYRPHIVQEPEERDYEACKEFANRRLQSVQSNVSSFNRIFFSDKRVLQADKKVDEHSVKIRRSEKPHDIREI